MATKDRPVELGPGGLKIVRQGDKTVALECVNTLGEDDTSTVSGVKASFEFVSGEMYKMAAIVKAQSGEMSPKELKKIFRSSLLAGAADESDGAIGPRVFLRQTPIGAGLKARLSLFSKKRWI